MTELIDALDAAGADGDAFGPAGAFTRFHIRFSPAARDTVFLSYMELRNLTDEKLLPRLPNCARRLRGAPRRISARWCPLSGDFSVPDCRVATLWPALRC